MDIDTYNNKDFRSGDNICRKDGLSQPGKNFCFIGCKHGHLSNILKIFEDYAYAKNFCFMSCKNGYLSNRLIFYEDYDLAFHQDIQKRDLIITFQSFENKYLIFISFVLLLIHAISFKFPFKSIIERICCAGR